MFGTEHSTLSLSTASRSKCVMQIISAKFLQSLSERSRVKIPLSHFAYACKMRCPLNLVLENSEYLWFYLTFCIVILDCGLKLHKLSVIPLSCFRND